MLKQYLTANAVFSGVSGLLMIGARNALSAEIPLPGLVWLCIGGGLLLFALQLTAMTVNTELAQKLTPQVIAADIAWVVLSVAGMLFAWTMISAKGVLLIIAVNVIVASLAYLQHAAYRRTHSAASDSAPSR